MLLKKLSLFTFHFSLFTFAALLLASCTSDEDTSPSYADKDRMEALIDRSIPAIANFCDKYGTYLLYDFDQKLDFAYQFEQAGDWEKAEITRINHDEAVVAVDFLTEKAFPCYSDEFIRKYFPRKILLASQVKTNLGIRLGRSDADARGYHQSMANVNSVTLARLGSGGVPSDPAEHDAYLKALHSTLLASYLVETRSEYPATETFYRVSKSYYSSLMNPNRVQARKLGVNFFHDRGFFFPEDDESTYFVSAQADMTQFIDSMVCMNQEMHDELLDITPMAQKICVLANGLKSLGVDVVRINPLLNDFMDASLFGVSPLVITSETIANTADAVLNFTVYRGARDLERADVIVNPDAADGASATVTVDLLPHSKDPRIACSANLSDLKIGDNKVRIVVYEVGRAKPAYTLDVNVVRISTDDVQYLFIQNSDNETWSLHLYNDYDYTTGRNAPGVTTIRFYKRATDVDWATGEETGREHNFWLLHKENGKVKEVNVLTEVIDYTQYTQSYQPVCTYYFDYNEYGELQQVRKDEEVIVSDVTYFDGNISGYSYLGKAYTPAYATAVAADNAGSEQVRTRVDCLDAQMSGRKFTFTGKEEYNPYFIAGLPAVIPGEEARIPLQILYSQYLFTGIEGAYIDGWALDKNTRFAVVSQGNLSTTYTYVYKTK